MNGEREITTPVNLTKGRYLNPEAVGFSRTPVHNTDGLGRGVGRNKRWEYWCVMTPDYIFSQTISNVDYAGVHTVWCFNRDTGELIDKTVIKPFGVGGTLPGTLDHGPSHVATNMLGARVDPTEDGNRLRAYTEGVSWDVTAHDIGADMLGVVVPWSEYLFQYTVKDVVRPATGTLIVGGQRYRLPEGQSWAILDHGRGRWPYQNTWNWGAGIGHTDGVNLGIQIGGKWTDGTGSRENGLIVDHDLYPIHEDLHWDYDPHNWLAPWRITSESIDLTLTPFWNHSSHTNVGVIESRADQCFGYYNGRVVANGRTIEVTDVLGFAEEVHNRW